MIDRDDAGLTKQRIDLRCVEAQLTPDLGAHLGDEVNNAPSRASVLVKRAGGRCGGHQGAPCSTRAVSLSANGGTTFELTQNEIIKCVRSAPLFLPPTLIGTVRHDSAVSLSAWSTKYLLDCLTLGAAILRLGTQRRAAALASPERSVLGASIPYR